MSLDDVDYYRRRALEERELAAKADNPEAANAQFESILATYLDATIWHSVRGTYRDTYRRPRNAFWL